MTAKVRLIFLLVQTFFYFPLCKPAWLHTVHNQPQTVTGCDEFIVYMSSHTTDERVYRHVFIQQ